MGVRLVYDSTVWTLVAGSGVNSGGNYGTKGDTLNTNYPGGRWGANARIDSTGTVWMFGGEGDDSTGANGLLNDLWTYNPTTKLWTWVSGDNVVNQAGVYGTLGTASASNVPGGRQTSAAWLDGSGNFWLFGGYAGASGGNLTRSTICGNIPQANGRGWLDLRPSTRPVFTLRWRPFPGPAGVPRRGRIRAAIFGSSVVKDMIPRAMARSATFGSLPAAVGCG